MLVTIRYLADKLWIIYAQKIMKWNFLLISKNKEQTELYSITFCDNGELMHNIQSTIKDYLLSKNL